MIVQLYMLFSTSLSKNWRILQERFKGEIVVKTGGGKWRLIRLKRSLLTSDLRSVFLLSLSCNIDDISTPDDDYDYNTHDSISFFLEFKNKKQNMDRRKIIKNPGRKSSDKFSLLIVLSCWCKRLCPAFYHESNGSGTTTWIKCLGHACHPFHLLLYIFVFLSFYASFLSKW